MRFANAVMGQSFEELEEMEENEALSIGGASAPLDLLAEVFRPACAERRRQRRRCAPRASSRIEGAAVLPGFPPDRLHATPRVAVGGPPHGHASPSGPRSAPQLAPS
jgi:hypothetical protein